MVLQSVALPAELPRHTQFITEYKLLIRIRSAAWPIGPCFFFSRHQNETHAHGFIVSSTRFSSTPHCGHRANQELKALPLSLTHRTPKSDTMHFLMHFETETPLVSMNYILHAHGTSESETLWPEITWGSCRSVCSQYLSSGKSRKCTYMSLSNARHSRRSIDVSTCITPMALGGDLSLDPSVFMCFGHSAGSF